MDPLGVGGYDLNGASVCVCVATKEEEEEHTRKSIISLFLLQQISLRLSYKLLWPEPRMVLNESADWTSRGKLGIEANGESAREISVQRSTLVPS